MGSLQLLNHNVVWIKHHFIPIPVRNAPFATRMTNARGIEWLAGFIVLEALKRRPTHPNWRKTRHT